jgi:DNA-binding transcriptional MerR regulator
MFTIGDFARHGRVSVRMLRHYDATGLLRPARVDPVSSYRFYAADQLARLNRIIALKDLGFTLDQVRAMLDQQVSAEQLRGMLRPRQAEIGRAATIVHRGSMDNVMATIQTLARWIDDNGYRSAGYPRELYLECPDDQDKWVTELQAPITTG